MNELANVSLERDGDTVIAGVVGEIDFSVADDIARRIIESIENEDATLILDLTRLSYTDSAGINLVFDLAARLRGHRQTLKIVLPVDSQPWRTFSIVGVDGVIPVFATIEEAKRAGGETEAAR
jgi:anti-sigma B factor antagonist